MQSLLRYLRPKCGTSCRRLVWSSWNPELYLESLVFHAKNSTDFPDEERRRLVIICQLPPTDAIINRHFYLTWLENKQDAFLSSSKFIAIVERRQWNNLSSPDSRVSFIWCSLSHLLPIRGIFSTKRGRFCNINDWIAIIEGFCIFFVMF